MKIDEIQNENHVKFSLVHKLICFKKTTSHEILEILEYIIQSIIVKHFKNVQPLFKNNHV